MTKDEKFLRNKDDGTIYRWHPILAKNPKCEEVTALEAFPEKFAKPAQVRKAKTRGKTLDLGTDEIPEPPVHTSPELAEEASKGLPE